MADPTKEPVQAVPFDFTKFTGFGATAGVAVVAVYGATKSLFDEAPDPFVALGIFLAAGLFGIAMAIAAGADVLARAYVTSHTTPDPDDAQKSIPVSVVLAEAIKKQGEEPRVVSMPRLKGIKVQGQPATLLALRIMGDKTEFQIQRSGEGEPDWVDPVAVEFP